MKRRLRAARNRWPLVDHAARAYGWAGQFLYVRQAASVTYFAFLSLFPLLALAFALLGYLAGWFPDIRPSVENTVAGYLPGLVGGGKNQLSLDSVRKTATGTGVLGLLTLLWTGTGLVDALRDAIRVAFDTTSEKASAVGKKLRDVVVLAVLGLLIVASVGASFAATAATQSALRLVDLEGSLAATILLRVLAIGVSVALDALVLAMLFRLLGGLELSWRQLRGGALLGAVALELLKQVAGYLLAGTTGNPLYATFAVVVGVLLWINFTCRVLMVSAAWVATEPTVAVDREHIRTIRPESLSPVLVVPDGYVPPHRRWGPTGAVIAVAGGVLVALRGRAAQGGSAGTGQ